MSMHMVTRIAKMNVVLRGRRPVMETLWRGASKAVMAVCGYRQNPAVVARAAMVSVKQRAAIPAMLPVSHTVMGIRSQRAPKIATAVGRCRRNPVVLAHVATVSVKHLMVRVHQLVTITGCIAESVGLSLIHI